MSKNKNTLLLALPEKSTAMPPLWASQNFLTSRAIIHRLIQRTNLTKNDHVIEIGPGKGHITRSLLETCRHVTAVRRLRRSATYSGFACFDAMRNRSCG